MRTKADTITMLGGIGAFMALLSGLAVYIGHRQKKANRADIKRYLESHGVENVTDDIVDDMISEYRKYRLNPKGYSGPYNFNAEAIESYMICDDPDIDYSYAN